jgi:hypothetical protein
VQFDTVPAYGRRLGKAPKREDPRTLRLAKYLTSAAPPAPSSFKYSAKVSNWPMYRNDELGDCTAAETGHQIQAWSAWAGGEQRITDADVLALYEATGGYIPGRPDTDNGAVVLDVLNYWRRTGVGGHRIGAFVDVTPATTAQIKQALWLFGGLTIGVGLPLSAQSDGTNWHLHGPRTGKNAPWSWGGHCVPVVDYNSTGLTCVSWGTLYRMTWGFFHVYCDEAWGVVSTDFLNAGHSPEGFDLAALNADLAAFGTPR